MRAPRRVFAVDDDPVILIILKHCLEAGGFDVTLFDSGSDAQALEALAHPPDRLVLDVMMPGLDGLEICRLLRAEESMDATRIIVMSGKDYDSDRRRALSLGADAFIAKPIEPTRFANQAGADFGRPDPFGGLGCARHPPGAGPARRSLRRQHLLCQPGICTGTPVGV